jgi:hypothetical protein
MEKALTTGERVSRLCTTMAICLGRDTGFFPPAQLEECGHNEVQRERTGTGEPALLSLTNCAQRRKRIGVEAQYHAVRDDAANGDPREGTGRRRVELVHRGTSDRLYLQHRRTLPDGSSRTTVPQLLQRILCLLPGQKGLWPPEVGETPSREQNTTIPCRSEGRLRVIPGSSQDRLTQPEQANSVPRTPPPARCTSPGVYASPPIPNRGIPDSGRRPCPADTNLTTHAYRNPPQRSQPHYRPLRRG